MPVYWYRNEPKNSYQAIRMEAGEFVLFRVKTNVVHISNRNGNEPQTTPPM